PRGADALASRAPVAGAAGRVGGPRRPRHLPSLRPVSRRGDDRPAAFGRGASVLQDAPARAAADPPARAGRVHGTAVDSPDPDRRRVLSGAAPAAAGLRL